MQGLKLRLLAALAAAAGVAGCSLPEVLPLTGAVTSGPSPYGAWYEQHWATNAVLLAAADDQGAEPVVTTEEIDAALGGDEAAVGPEAEQTDATATVEVNADTGEATVDFDNTSPYQFPSSSYAPGGPDQGVGASDVLVPARPQAPEPNTAPAPAVGGPIRY